jgi:N,N-dimethylformamidase
VRGWEPGKPYLLGYSQHLSVRPGAMVDVRVSTQFDSYTVDLVRLRHGDENPAGPGFLEASVGEIIRRTLPGRVQPTPMGSVIRIPPAPFFDVDRFALRLWFQPTLFDPGQHLVSWLDDDKRGVELVLAPANELLARFPGTDSTITVGPLRLWIWHLIDLAIERSTGWATLTVRSKPRSPVRPIEMSSSVAVSLNEWEVGQCPIIIGGQNQPQSETPPEISHIGTLYGRVADPCLWHCDGENRLGPSWEGPRPPSDAPNLIAFWDLGADPRSDLCRDIGPHSHHGRLLNGGTRLVTGPHFADPGINPTTETHSAIHLHADDVLDSRWEVDLKVGLPETLEPGIHAIRLAAPDRRVEDHIPLFVRGRSTEHRIAVLFPTNTYTAYGNERMNFGTVQLPDAERADRLQPIDRFIEANSWLGASLYDEHLDRSGVTRVSRHRPLVTMRPEYRSWLSGDPRHLSADLYLVDWLESHGYRYDVLTDEDLHCEGLAALAPFQVVLTGGHPEYVTGPMLDAIHGYLEQGGRLMYTGGNGFYWVTTVDGRHPEVIEVRRGFAGSRTWESLPGDDRHTATGEIGGLWRHRGRPPNELVGVGFAASGWGGRAGAFRVIEPVPERASFVFDGVDIDRPIGDYGLIMAGCVGDEVDRWDPELGTPTEAMRLATCEDLNDSYVIVVEDTIGTGTDITSTLNPRVRADMTLLPTDNGGSVFSVGTMAWLGSLSHNGYDNAVSRITKNVLDRFLQESPI